MRRTEKRGLKSDGDAAIVGREKQRKTVGCVRANGKGGNREKETEIEIEREGGRDEVKRKRDGRKEKIPSRGGGWWSMVRKGGEGGGDKMM